MPNESPEVAEFLHGLAHPLKDGIIDMRAAVLASDDQITEHVKWNAPSFCFQGEDRVTSRLQPGDRLQLVFHRGAKVRADSDDFTFDDDTGLLEWASPDRATLTLRDLEEAQGEAAHGGRARWSLDASGRVVVIRTISRPGATRG